MDGHRFDRLTRRSVLGSMAAALGSGATPIPDGVTVAKRKQKCRTCCLANGNACAKKNAKCRPQNCLQTPFTIEAHWTNPDTDHDTFVFVPKQAGRSAPHPFLYSVTCNPELSGCENNVYPFVCVSQDAIGPGDEVTTVRRLLPGRYEYWIELHEPSPARDVTVTLRNANGKVLLSLSSPPNPSSTEEIGWHVFDIDGARHSVTRIDQATSVHLPRAAYPAESTTDVCPPP